MPLSLLMLALLLRLGKQNQLTKLTINKTCLLLCLLSICHPSLPLLLMLGQLDQLATIGCKPNTPIRALFAVGGCL